MPRFRQRIAIGTFPTVDDAELMISRLQALGITRYERLSVPSAHHGAAPATTTLRIHLDSSTQEQLVAGALLASAASSVQLHDIDDGGRA